MRWAPAFQLVTMPSGLEHEDGVVGHALDEQAELLFAAPQRLFGGPALGQVARDLGEAEQRAVGRQNRIDDDVGPEASPVLPDAPALGLETALLGRDAQCALGQPRAAVLRGIEAREVPADDLLLAIALQALGPGVPADDVAGRVQHVDRVVGDRVDEQPIARLRIEPFSQTVLICHGPMMHRGAIPPQVTGPSGSRTRRALPSPGNEGACNAAGDDQCQRRQPGQRQQQQRRWRS